MNFRSQWLTINLAWEILNHCTFFQILQCTVWKLRKFTVTFLAKISSKQRFYKRSYYRVDFTKLLHIMHNTAQRKNCYNLVSIFGKNFVKVTFFQKKLLKSYVIWRNILLAARLNFTHWSFAKFSWNHIAACEYANAWMSCFHESFQITCFSSTVWLIFTTVTQCEIVE